MPNHDLKNVSFEQVALSDGFWKERLEIHKREIIPVCIANCEVNTQRINNFKRAAGKMEGPFEGIYYDDSDVYKALEGIAYSLAVHPDPELEKKADEWIDAIASAQQEDGYLVTYFILGTNGEPRWTDMERHEDYCLGHMIEGAIAYKHATGKDKFLNVAIRFADHFADVVGEGKKHWVTGHEELELALVKLYRETKNEKYLHLANWLLEERGHGYGVGSGIWGKADWGPKYAQDDKPVSEMTDIAGHAVRAMYLYCGLCDVAKETENNAYLSSLNRLWESAVLRNMYITGGIGSSRDNEGFTADYDLPNDTAYCETCAAVGMALWNNRMNLLHQDGKYADIVEKELYNGALAGVSLDGRKFFYVNPLSSNGEHHRQEWYGTACCPTQLSRFLPSVGNYLYAYDNTGIWVNQYIASVAKLRVDGADVTITQKGNFPWEGKMEVSLRLSQEAFFELNLRMPSWCSQYTLSVNGKEYRSPYQEKGYIKLYREWNNGDTVTIDLAMKPTILRAHPKVKNDAGAVAVMRGPLVYCAEQIDNPETFDSVIFDADTTFTQQWEEQLLNGVMTITAHTKSGSLKLIPYYAWDNREACPMKVWIPFKD